MLFRKKNVIKVNVIDFSMQRIGTGQVGAYILHYLYDELKFRHIGYDIFTVDGEVRCFLFTVPGNKEVINYFKDCCPGMIEEKVSTFEGLAHNHNLWENGFSEVSKCNE